MNILSKILIGTSVLGVVSLVGFVWTIRYILLNSGKQFDFFGRKLNNG